MMLTSMLRLTSVVLLLLAAIMTMLAAAMLRVLISALMMPIRRLIAWSQWFASLEVDVDPAGVLLGPVLQAQLSAQLLDLWLDLLDVTSRVMPLADNCVEVSLARCLIGSNPLLKHILRLLDIQAVQVYAVRLDATSRVVGAKDVF